MKEISVSLENVLLKDDYYEVKLKMSIKGKDMELTIPDVVKKPSLVRHEYREEYLVIKLIDETGEGIASCCIHKDHIERGCLECESLVHKPSKP